MGDKMYLLLKGKAVLYFSTQAKELDEEEKRRKNIPTPEVHLIDRGKWDLFIYCINNEKATLHSDDLFETFNKKLIHPYMLYTMLIGKYDIYVGKDFMRFHVFHKYGSGGIFGEKALTHQQPRAGTIICTEDSHLAEMTAKNFMNFFSGKIEQEKKDREFLKDVFKQLSSDIFLRLPHHFTEQSFKINEVIFRQDTPIKHIYILNQGTVEVGFYQSAFQRSQTKKDC